MAFTRTSFPVGALACNCTILADTESKQAVVVDPGGDAEVILNWCAKNDLKIEMLIHTHGHFDHILAAAEIKAKTGAKIALHEEDRWLYENIELQGQAFGFDLKNAGTFDIALEHEQVECFGCVKIKTLFTPGHTPGSVCFHVDDEKLLLSGDTLFAGSIGRTDLWGGDMNKIMTSIQTRLTVLDEETLIIPGHGPSTTLLKELESNPFIREWSS